ncbi:MAG: hypothetical protein RIR79_144 [Pseudomonadota bacterium]
MTGFPTHIPVARYRFTARMRVPLELPHYAGSLLRGQFGSALRHITCMTRQPTCAGCPLQSTCPYSRIFEAPAPPKGSHTLQKFSQIPNPYIMEPPPPSARALQAGEDFVFHIVLIGHAREQLALVLFALQRALARGLTRERADSDLQQVDYVDATGHVQTVWTHDNPILKEHQNTIELIAGDAHYTGDSSGLCLKIHTPMRLQNQGHPLGVAELTPRVLVSNLARRTALLMEFHADQKEWGESTKHIAQLSQTLSDTRQLRWYDWTRYSSRQRQEMKLGGVLGSWILHGDAAVLSQIYPWLWLGQWLHIGKNATFGMGAYSLCANHK